MEFSNSLYKVLFEDTGKLSPKNRASIYKLFQSLPFEHLLELCPSKQKAEYLLVDLYNSYEFNAIHKAIAHAFITRNILSLITTNYDNCIDSVLRTSKGFEYTKIVSEIDAQKESNDNKPTYFKIHGSAGYDDNEKPVFTLSRESLLPPGKRRLLKDLIGEKTILFIGYSGLDFDICPEIDRIPNIKVCWNTFSTAFPSYNAERLINKKNGTQICGDMRVLISDWIYPINVDRSTYQGDVAQLIKSSFSQDELQMWQIEILNSIGTPDFILEALSEKTNMLDNRFKRKHFARAMFHKGKYNIATRKYIENAISNLFSGRRAEAADCLVEASDSVRSAGSTISPFLLILLGLILERKTTLARAILKVSLIFARLAEVTTILHLTAITKKALPFIKRLLIICAKESILAGNWFDFQQVSLIASRLDIPLEELENDVSYPPPNPKDGYSHLGYYIGNVMVLIDNCRTIIAQKNTKNRQDLHEEILKNYLICVDIGLDTGAWKLLALLYSFEDDKGKWINNHHANFLKYFWNCDYIWWTRNQQAKRYGLNKELIKKNTS